MCSAKYFKAIIWLFMKADQNQDANDEQPPTSFFLERMDLLDT